MKSIKLLKDEIYERVKVIESSNLWYIENFVIEHNKVVWFRSYTYVYTYIYFKKNTQVQK